MAFVEDTWQKNNYLEYAVIWYFIKVQYYLYIIIYVSIKIGFAILWYNKYKDTKKIIVTYFRIVKITITRHKSDYLLIDFIFYR